ncbi:tetratricopeptide repeat protein [Paludibacter jiangxiensis]|uniref:Tetratricopeptide repeat-containing protein n=1 Tax=Paludibacter jiangxiensis TaxID=681398 RepID=A0A170ZZ81_9BACT|nr:hypothetical protein [Paludibacter jiangxiensis]GAT63142.1 hypothetical protein PJIAN_3456 [Paludibacter jiangxiensis]
MKTRSQISIQVLCLILLCSFIPSASNQINAQSAIGQLEHMTGVRIDRGNTSSSYNTNTNNSYSASYYKRLEKASNYNERAIRFMNSGDYGKAIRMLKKAQWYDPFNATVKSNLAKARAAHDRSHNAPVYKPVKPTPQVANNNTTNNNTTSRPRPFPGSGNTSQGTGTISNGSTPTNNNLTITTLDGKTRSLKLCYDYRYMAYSDPNKGIEEKTPEKLKLEDYREYKIAEYYLSKIEEVPGGKLPAAIGTFMLNVTNNTFTAVQDATDAFVTGKLTDVEIQNLSVKVVINKSLTNNIQEAAVDVAHDPYKELGVEYLDRKFGKISKTFSKLGIDVAENAKDLYEIYKAPSIRDEQTK